MSEKKIYHLSYVSTGCDCLKYEDIKSILESSNKNNKEIEITGILVYCNKHFFQIIEGEKQDVLELYEKIAIDRRHDNIIKIQEAERDIRLFNNWSMAFKSYNKELSSLDNFNLEQFYSYINDQIKISQNDVSLKVLADFFDLNG
jgi:hypothetical protein